MDESSNWHQGGQSLSDGAAQATVAIVCISSLGLLWRARTVSLLRLTAFPPRFVSLQRTAIVSSAACISATALAFFAITAEGFSVADFRMATTTPHAPATYFLQVFAYLCYYTASYIFLGLLLYRVTDLNAFVAAGTKARHSLSDARVSLLLLGLLMLISMGGVAVYWNVPLGSNFFFSLWMLGVWLGHLFIVLASFRACRFKLNSPLRRFKGSLYTLTALQFLYAAVGILALCVPWDYSQQTLAAVFASFINVMLALNATSSLDFILQLHSAAEWTPADAEQELTVHANDCGEDDAVLLVSSG